jgi:hypothetical protein
MTTSPAAGRAVAHLAEHLEVLQPLDRTDAPTTARRAAWLAALVRRRRKPLR